MPDLREGAKLIDEGLSPRSGVAFVLRALRNIHPTGLDQWGDQVDPLDLVRSAGIV
jgi:hypothetical protein